MLLVIDTYRFFVADIKDASTASISATFEVIGHPEYYFDKMFRLDSVEIDQTYDIYDDDDIITADTARIDIENAEPIGTFKVVSNKYITVDGTIDLE